MLLYLKWIYRSAEWDLVESRTDIPASASEGEFYMSIECFMKHFETVTICNLIPEQDKLGSEERSSNLLFQLKMKTLLHCIYPIIDRNEVLILCFVLFNVKFYNCFYLRSEVKNQ